jgi:hypothetical protein
MHFLHTTIDITAITQEIRKSLTIRGNLGTNIERSQVLSSHMEDLGLQIRVCSELIGRKREG